MMLNAIKSKTCPPKYIPIDNMNMNTIINYKEKINDANIYDKLVQTLCQTLIKTVKLL